MEPLDFLFNAFFGGLFVFFTEELFQSAKYSMLTLAVSLVIGMLSLVITRRFGKYISLIITGALVAVFTAAFRAAVVYGGFVTFIAGVDCFALRDLQLYTYVLFAFSGAFAGLILTLFKKGNLWTHLIGILGITCGVLYHLKVAQGWWSARPLVAIPLFVGEFLAPSFFAVGLLWFLEICIRFFRVGYYNWEKGLEGTTNEQNGPLELYKTRCLPQLKGSISRARSNSAKFRGRKKSMHGGFVRNPYKMIWMKCPSSGMPVKTGINSAYFEKWNDNPPKDGAEFACSECGQKHAFDKTNTWLEDISRN